MRIFIGPVEVAGIAAGLKTGFDSLGVRSEAILSYPHLFGYAKHPSRPIARCWAALGRLHLHPSRRRPLPLRLLTGAIWRAWSLLVWLWALTRFDAFIFLFGNTITNSRIEARLYKLLHKKVVVVYCGSDGRPPYLDGPTFHSIGAEPMAKFDRLGKKISARIRLHEQCDFICVNSPLTAQFHSRAFVNWFEMGLPRNHDEQIHPPEQPATAEAPVRILHSPSQAVIKGTERIIDIVNSLREEGHSIDLVLLTGVPNEQVQVELATCDFVIDQCWADSPMAGFAVEAAHHAKPAVVGGYAASEEFQRYFPTNLPRSLFVHPDALQNAVRELVLNRELRIELGRRAQGFVRQQWAPEKVARRYLSLLQGRGGSELLASPAPYVHGCGLPESAARDTVRALLRQRGLSALHLSHNQPLEQAFLAFAGADADQQAPQ